MSHNLNDLLPIFEVANDGILSKTGEFTVGFEITKQPLFNLSAEELAKLHQYWVKALRSFAGSVVIHLQDLYTSSTYQSPVSAESFLEQSSLRHFHERPYRSHKCYCFITFSVGSRKPGSPLSTLLQPHILPENLLRPKFIEDFLGRCGEFGRILSDSKLVMLTRLTLKDLVSVAPEAGVIERYFMLSGALGPLLQDIQLRPEIQVGDRRCVLFTLADAELLPAQCSSNTSYEPYSTEITQYPIGFASWLGPLLDADHIYNQFIFLNEPGPALSRLESRRRRLQALSRHSRENAVAEEAIGQFLQEAAESQRMVVKAHFNIMAWADDPADVKDVKQKVSSAIARMGAVPHLETIGAARIWEACIPGNAANLPMYDTFDTFAEQAACFLIPETNDKSSVSPFGIRLGDRLTGIPLHVDISDKPLSDKEISNRNKFVLGGSGSGKSFTVNHLLRSYFEQGAHIVLGDIGGSYKSLCELLGGLYITYDEAAPLSLNPFRLDARQQPDVEKMESIIAILLTIWKKDDEPFSRSEHVALVNAVRDYYDYLARHSQVEPSFDSFYEFLIDHYSVTIRNERISNKDFDFDNLLFVLKPYYKGGVYDYLLNAREQPSFLHERLIVFELDNIKELTR